MHIHQINLQPMVGGGEIFTRTLTRALAEAGARVSLYVHPANRVWDGLPGLVPVAGEEELLARLPRERSVVVTQGPLSASTVEKIARAHHLVAFAHMPVTGGRSAEEFRSCRLVVAVSQYCIDLLRRAGIEQVYPEPLYGAVDLERGAAEPVVARSPYVWDRKKLRDRLLGALEPLFAPSRAPAPFGRAPGLTLGVVSLISPIKQLPRLYSILAPLLAARRAVRLEIFGEGGYAQVRDLRRALAPLAGRARFWGHQRNVAAVYPQLDYLMTGLPEKEALGLNVLEAQACGTPVLAPKAPPFTETMVDGASGFLYRDPREDGGAQFEKLLDSILGGRARPDPRVAANKHLEKFSYAALVERARVLAARLSELA
jgi:glycosyltransferase involved in cell wall biosynthesis